MSKRCVERQASGRGHVTCVTALFTRTIKLKFILKKLPALTPRVFDHVKVFKKVRPFIKSLIVVCVPENLIVVCVLENLIVIKR